MCARNVSYRRMFGRAAAVCLLVCFTTCRAQVNEGIPSTRPDSSMREGFTIVAKMVQDKYILGEPVVLDVFVENMTDGDLDFPLDDSERNFVFAASNSNGKTVPFTTHGTIEQKGLIDRISRRYLVNLQRGQMAHFRFPLETIFDLTAVDTYSIHVTFRVPDTKKVGVQRFVADTVLESNDVTFQISKHSRIDPMIEQILVSSPPTGTEH
jgi:hypothetical protein